MWALLRWRLWAWRNALQIELAVYDALSTHGDFRDGGISYHSPDLLIDWVVLDNAVQAYRVSALQDGNWKTVYRTAHVSGHWFVETNVPGDWFNQVKKLSMEKK
jgi:hypothetical protein